MKTVTCDWCNDYRTTKSSYDSAQQALRGHKKKCPSRPAAQPNDLIGEFSMPATLPATRAVGENIEKTTVGNSSNQSNALAPNAYRAGNLPAGSSSPREEKRGEEGFFSSSLEVADPARDVKQAVAFIGARKQFLDEWEFKFFLRVERRVTSEGRLSTKEKELLLEIEAVVRGLSANEEIETQYMERARHPLELADPNHDKTACRLCREEVEAKKRADEMFDREFAEMMAGLSHWTQHKNQPDCSQCETYREWKRVNG